MIDYAKEIHSNYEGYNAIAHAIHDAVAEEAQSVQIRFPAWVDGQMCACLGAMIRLFMGKHNISCALGCIDIKVDTLFRSNGFYEKLFAKEKNVRYKPTSIPYEEFMITNINANANKKFNDYLDHEFLRNKMPTMSDGAWKKFTECLAEIFENARYHSASSGIYVCGQYYYTHHKLAFSIADIGIGFKGRLKENLDVDLSSIKAIEWAMTAGNTTKTKVYGPGGRGLSVLRNFIEMNKGKLQIVSHEGFWERNNQGIIMRELEYAFPGTVVSLEIDTSDSNRYFVKGEL